MGYLSWVVERDEERRRLDRELEAMTTKQVVETAWAAWEARCRRMLARMEED
jgi:hypothetical protein